ncbi:hypothetical protein ACWDO0_03590 [Nocardia rhamnosiphila]
MPEPVGVGHVDQVAGDEASLATIIRRHLEHAAQHHNPLFGRAGRGSLSNCALRKYVTVADGDIPVTAIAGTPTATV